MFERAGRAGEVRFFVVVERHGVGAGKDDETKGLGGLGVKPGTRSGDKEPHGASRPDINQGEALPRSGGLMLFVWSLRRTRSSSPERPARRAGGGSLLALHLTLMRVTTFA